MILSPAGAPHSHGGLYPALFSALLCSFRRSIVCSHGTAKPAGFFLLWKNRRSTPMGLPPRPSGAAESSPLAAGGPAAQEACARRCGSLRSPGNHWFLSYTFFFKNAIVLFSRCINFRWDFSPPPLPRSGKKAAGTPPGARRSARSGLGPDPGISPQQQPPQPFPFPQPLPKPLPPQQQQRMMISRMIHRQPPPPKPLLQHPIYEVPPVMKFRAGHGPRPLHSMSPGGKGYGKRD